MVRRGTAPDLALAWVLSTSVKAPIAGLAASNGLRPGLAMLIKQLADELGPSGTRVVGLLPGRVETERVQHLDSLADDPAAARAASEESIALRRYGQPEEFARVAAFVLSPAASYLTGSMIPSTAARCAVCDRRWSAGRRCAADRAGELGAVELGVQAALGQQLLVPAALDDPPRSTTRIRSALRMVDSRWAITMLVRPSMARSSARWTAASDSESRWAVASSSTTIGGRLQQQPGDRQPLPLTAGQPVAALPDHRVQPVRQAATRSPIWAARAPATSLVGRVRPGVAQVVPDRVMEHVRVLGDIADRGAQRGQLEIAYVDAADLDGSAADVVQPGDQMGDGRLAGAGAADQRNRLPGADGERTSCSTSAFGRCSSDGDGLQAGQGHLVGARVGEATWSKLDRRPTVAPAAASGASAIIGSRSSTSNTRSKLTRAFITSIRRLVSWVSGP